DRNRTSPFAFTGNRFEFRAVGGSCHPATPMTILNAALAAQLIEFKGEVDALIDEGVKKDEAIFQVLREYIIASKAIRFEGDNYSDDWVKEAEKRGLTNVTDVPEALNAYLSDQSKKLFFDLGIFTEAELEGRVEVLFEQYTMKVQIEARVLGDLSINHIVPTAVKYQNRLVENVLGLKQIYGEEYKKLAGNRIELIKEISDHVTSIKTGVNDMVEARKVANKLKDEKEKSKQYSKTVTPFLDKIRIHIDKLELIVDDEIWPLPKYRELLFSS
ncbi:MAG: glutamine synthetase type III, partial [Bacteroidales bacterium]|nr:glutamine synthetase type III [Bacteroidales bacterium]